MQESFEMQNLYQKAITTDNVALALKEAAFAWHCSLEELDFDILNVKTFYGDEELFFAPNELEFMLDDERPKMVRQEVNILIFKRSKEIQEDIKVALAANDDITQVFAAIKANTTITARQYSKDTFKDLMNKRMLLNRLLINTWSLSLEEATDKIFKVVHKKQVLTLLKDLKFSIAKGKSFTPDTKEELIKHYLNETNSDSLDRVNHASRDFIRSVKKGELLVEYFFYQKGSLGRNIRGQVLGKLASSPNDTMIPMIDDASIRMEAHKYGINYYAKRNGYINMSEPILAVSEKLELQQANFRKTGDIQGVIGKNIDVAIGDNPSSSYDAVGMGVTVEADTIHVKGSTGSHSILRAKEVTVDGKTHQKSSIYTDKAKLNIHAGSLIAKSAMIHFLEMGEVKGEMVQIDDLFSGTVIAKEVVIHKLRSNAKITATHSIRIDTIEGSENHIKIDNHHHKHKVEELNTKIQTEIQHINRQQRLHHEKSLEKKRNLEPIKETVAVLQDYKKRRREPPAALLEKVKSFKAIDSDLFKIKLDIKEHQMTLELLEASRYSLEKELLESRITIGKVEEGHNTIEFHLHASEKSFTQTARPFTTYQVGKAHHGGYEVQVQSYVDGHL